MDKNQLFVAIDFETANSNPLSACAVGLVVFDDGEIIFEYESLIKPPQEHSNFFEFNVGIHNIHSNDVVDAPKWNEIYPLFKDYLSDAIIVAHNVNFDLRILKALNAYYRLNLPRANYFCSVDLSRLMLPYLSNHKLNTVSDFLNIDLDHHNAKSDAIACAMIVYKCMYMSNTTKIIDLLQNVNLNIRQLTS